MRRQETTSRITCDVCGRDMKEVGAPVEIILPTDYQDEHAEITTGESKSFHLTGAPDLPEQDDDEPKSHNIAIVYGFSTIESSPLDLCPACRRRALLAFTKYKER